MPNSAATESQRLSNTKHLGSGTSIHGSVSVRVESRHWPRLHLAHLTLDFRSLFISLRLVGSNSKRWARCKRGSCSKSRWGDWRGSPNESRQRRSLRGGLAGSSRCFAWQSSLEEGTQSFVGVHLADEEFVHRLSNQHGWMDLGPDWCRRTSLHHFRPRDWTPFLLPNKQGELLGA